MSTISTTIDIRKKYQYFCEKHQVPFENIETVNSYDDTTLFCPAGMQKYKLQFKDLSLKKTVANIQSCLRLNDYDLTGDGTHMICFDMMGFFSFREWSLKQTIDFWVKFIQTELNLPIDYVTIHPDKYDEWKKLYSEYSFDIRKDDECQWSDGSPNTQPSYCTEFYHKDIEIGNIVNPMNGTCIDVGFGFDRLDFLVNQTPTKSKLELYKIGMTKIINSGFKISHNKEGYIWKKLIRDYVHGGGTIEDTTSVLYDIYNNEVKRQSRLIKTYHRFKKNMETKMLNGGHRHMV